MDKFRVLVSCAGLDFSYRGKQELTLGVDITAEVAKDLLRAGFIEPIESTERAVVAPKETATRKVTPADSRTVRPKRTADSE